MTNENVLEEDLLTVEKVTSMPQDEKISRLNRYREFLTKSENNKLSDNAYHNAILLLREVRKRDIISNSKATKKTKSAAEVAPVDLSEF